jgi:hypothetical protein
MHPPESNQEVGQMARRHRRECMVHSINQIRSVLKGIDGKFGWSLRWSLAVQIRSTSISADIR